MAKHPDYVLRKNATRGAITTWCPGCKRKSALGQHMAGGRKCRYCGYFSASNSERKELYKKWIAGGDEVTG